MGFTTIVKPHLAERWRKEGHWRDETFFDVLARHAELHPDREVFVDGQERITYGALKRRSSGAPPSCTTSASSAGCRHHPAAEPHRVSHRLFLA